MDPIVTSTKPSSNSLPGFFEPKNSVELNKPIRVKSLPNMSLHEAVIFENALSSDECKKLIDFMHTSDNFKDVGVQGMLEGKDDRIGSKRTSIWSPDVAEQIWNRLESFLPNVQCTQYTATDWWQGFDFSMISKKCICKKYKPVAFSPLLRFMKYATGGQHYAHYDAGFIYPNHEYRTLKSVVIYLTTNEGAATRFIKDNQDNVDIWDRKHLDWDREVKEDEIIAKSECIQGNVLVFNHRICHDVEQYMGNDTRIIIRGDVVYKMI